MKNPLAVIQKRDEDGPLWYARSAFYAYEATGARLIRLKTAIRFARRFKGHRVYTVTLTRFIRLA